MSRRRVRRHGLAAALLLGVLAGMPLRAQETRVGGPSPAAGIDATERRLYDAVRRAPRDAAARAALGAWLASRGQLRSGAVLLEEARLFGGSPRVIAARLAPIYEWLRDWASLAALPASPLSEVERARANALAGREASVTGADRATVSFAPLELGALGRVAFVVGTDTLWGDVDSEETGIVLPGLGRGAGVVEVLGVDARGAVGVIRAVGLADLTLHDVPMRVEARLGAGRARLGFDVLARLGATVNARAATVTLRRDGKVDARADAEGIPFVLGFPGVRLALRADAPAVPIGSPAARAALRGRPWTVDLRRGVIWVHPAQ